MAVTSCCVTLSPVGKTPWGGAFLEALGRMDSNGRLQRGKTYANTGKVLYFHVKENVVTARVKGSFQPFYEVRLEFSRLSEEEQATIAQVVESNPQILGGILNGELPTELLKALEKAHVQLLPTSWGQVYGGCNCPDNQGVGGFRYGAPKPSCSPC